MAGILSRYGCTLCGAEVRREGAKCADCLATARFHLGGRETYAFSSSSTLSHSRHSRSSYPNSRHTGYTGRSSYTPHHPPPPNTTTTTTTTTTATTNTTNPSNDGGSTTPPPKSSTLRYAGFMTSPSLSPSPSRPYTSPLRPTSPPNPPTSPPTNPPPTTSSPPPPPPPSNPPASSPSTTTNPPTSPGGPPQPSPEEQFEAQLAAQVQLAFDNRKKKVGKLGFKSSQVRVVSPDQVMMLVKPPLPNSPLTRMQLYMQQMLNNATYADVFFDVGGVSVHGHRAVLANHSPVFRELFAAYPEHRAVIPVADTRAIVFKKVLKFLYMEVTETTLQVCMEMIPVTQWLNLRYLLLLCAVRLAQSISTANAVWVYRGAVATSIAPLRRVALDFILANFDAVSATPAFMDLEREPLVAIISARAASLPSTVSRKKNDS